MEEKKMLQISGHCSFCGQRRMVEIPEGFIYGEEDDLATRECDCSGAVAKRQREQRIAETSDKIAELFAEEYPEISDLLNATLTFVAKREIKKVSVDNGDGIKAFLSMNEDGVFKVERKETSSMSRQI